MKYKRLYSVKYRVLGIFFAFFIPLAVGLIVYSINMLKKAETVVYENGRSGFGMYMELLENEVDAIDIYLSDIILQNEEIRALNTPKSTTETYLLSYDVRHRFSAPVKANPGLLSMMVFTQENDYMLSMYSDDYQARSIYTADLSGKLENTVMEICVQGGNALDSWFYLELEGRHLYCRIKNYGSVYCAGVMDMELIAGDIERNYNNGGRVIFYDNNGVFINGSDFILENAIRIPDNDGTYEISGKNQRYMGFMNSSDHFRAAYLMPYSGSSQVLSSNEGIILFCTVFIIIAVPFVFSYLKKYILSPLRMLEQTMRQISAGNFALEDHSHYNSTEFEQVNVTFRHMLREIRVLKIESYEKELNRRKIEFQYLQLQIRPHFLFNCMKNLYGMAQSGKTEEMKQSILLLSNHLRYIFTSDTDLVPLSKELWQCQNYMELMQITGQLECSFFIDIEAGLEELPVPPISLLTFVENSVKYALNEARSLSVTIHAQTMTIEDVSYIKIEVMDSGPGFETEVMKQLNRQKEITDANGRKHVGIYNVLQRCRFNFGEKFYATFTNSGGARVNLLIPKENEGGDLDAAIDCGRPV